MDQHTSNCCCFCHKTFKSLGKHYKGCPKRDGKDYQHLLSKKTITKKQSSKAKKVPCPICNKKFLRLETHLRTSASCKTVTQPIESPPSPPNSSLCAVPSPPPRSPPVHCVVPPPPVNPSLCYVAPPPPINPPLCSVAPPSPVNPSLCYVAPPPPINPPLCSVAPPSSVNPSLCYVAPPPPINPPLCSVAPPSPINSSLGSVAPPSPVNPSLCYVAPPPPINPPLCSVAPSSSVNPSLCYVPPPPPINPPLCSVASPPPINPSLCSTTPAPINLSLGTVQRMKLPQTADGWKEADEHMKQVVVPNVLQETDVNVMNHMLCYGIYSYFTTKYGTQQHNRHNQHQTKVLKKSNELKAGNPETAAERLSQQPTQICQEDPE